MPIFFAMYLYLATSQSYRKCQPYKISARLFKIIFILLLHRHYFHFQKKKTSTRLNKKLAKSQLMTSARFLWDFHKIKQDFSQVSTKVSLSNISAKIKQNFNKLSQTLPRGECKEIGVGDAEVLPSMQRCVLQMPPTRASAEDKLERIEEKIVYKLLLLRTNLSSTLQKLIQTLENITFPSTAWRKLSYN